jgi:hypothetical protein
MPRGYHAGMALVMVRFEDGPLRGVTLPVDHLAEEYRHTVRESVPDGSGDRGDAVRTTVHVYRRTGRTAFALDHAEDGGFD